MAKLSLVVVSHDRKVLEAECEHVGLPGRLGDLGILPGHAPLLATLRPGVLSYRDGSSEQRIAISSGFLEVADDIVTVLVSDAQFAGDVDREECERLKQEASSELEGAKPEQLESIEDRVHQAEARLTITSG